MEEEILQFPSDDDQDEMVDADEVERVLTTLSYLLEITGSESIRDILDNACCEIAELVEGDDDDESDAAESEAA